MSQPYIGQIKIFGFNFAPKGWALCNGQLMAIQQNQALFSILGTVYGGDGIRTFGLPNLQGCAPMHRSNSYPQGAYVGEENHTLTLPELPAHTHLVAAMPVAGTAPNEASAVLAAAASGTNMYTPAGGSTLVPLAPATVGMAGGSQSHPNQQPYLVLNSCIALQGIFPSRN